MCKKGLAIYYQNTSRSPKTLNSAIVVLLTMCNPQPISIIVFIEDTVFTVYFLNWTNHEAKGRGKEVLRFGILTHFHLWSHHIGCLHLPLCLESELVSSSRTHSAHSHLAITLTLDQITQSTQTGPHSKMQWSFTLPHKARDTTHYSRDMSRCK